MSWPIAETAVAAGLAWYLTRDVLGHVQPFFAPIAAAVCLWVTNAVRALLAQVDYLAGGSAVSTSHWMFAGADELNVLLAQLSEARSVAAQLVRVAPRRWTSRNAVGIADRQAAQLTLLSSSVLYLARTVTTTANTGEQLCQPLRAAISDLAGAGAALAAGDQSAAACSASVRRHTAASRPGAHTTAQEAVIAAVIDTCADELYQAIDIGAQ